MTELIEYRVRSKTIHFVTRFESGTVDGDMILANKTTQYGHFESEDEAYTVATALAFKEREDLGWPPGDERMQFAQKGG
jgi:hypothetical protein